MTLIRTLRIFANPMAELRSGKTHLAAMSSKALLYSSVALWAASPAAYAMEKDVHNGSGATLILPQSGDSGQGDFAHSDSAHSESGQDEIAQDVEQPSKENPSVDDIPGDDEDVSYTVTGQRVKGSVVTDVPPVDVLDQQDIASYGASSLADVLEAISPQTTSGRGRGSGGRPVVLMNGLRVSSFRAIRDLPPEAIKKVEVFPEEVALQYGYPADQRVVNFILVDNYNGISAEAEYGMSTQGGYDEGELEATWTRINGPSRLVVDLDYEFGSSIFESERDIEQSDRLDSYRLDGVVDAQTMALGEGDGTDIGDYRTLSGGNDTFEATVSWARELGKGTVLEVTGGYDHSETTSFFGLNAASLNFAADNPYSPFADDVTLNRLFLEPRPLERHNESDGFNLSASVNGNLANSWRYNLSSSYDYSTRTTHIDEKVDFTEIQKGLNATNIDDAIDPFASPLGVFIPGLEQDISKNKSQTWDNVATVNGALAYLPAGDVMMTFTTGYSHDSIDTSDTRTMTGDVRLARDEVFGRVNMDVPLLERGFDNPLGKISINGRLGYSELGDFGGLTDFGYGVVWSPASRLSMEVSLFAEEVAPGLSQLNAPLVVNPNVTYYDFVTGNSVLISTLSGGNPNLQAEDQRDVKISLNWRPEFAEGLTLTSDYNRSQSYNVSSSFPTLTAETEAAFSDRVIRDADGNLISVDQRPVNYDRTLYKNIRTGLSYRGNISDGDNEAAQGRGGRGGRGGGTGGRPSGGRWFASLFHTYVLDDMIFIRPGVDELDRLNGSATGGNGGTSEHQFQLQAGAFHKGVGFRLSGNYQSGSHVDGTATSSGLQFHDIATFDAQIFLDFNNFANLSEKVPFLKGSRLRIRVDNIFGGIRKVTDDDGNVPLAYQPGYVDSKGRVISLSFRKRF